MYRCALSTPPPYICPRWPFSRPSQPGAPGWVTAARVTVGTLSTVASSRPMTTRWPASSRQTVTPARRSARATVVATTTVAKSRNGGRDRRPASGPPAWPLTPEHRLGDTPATARATRPVRGSWGLARRVDRLPASRPLGNDIGRRPGNPKRRPSGRHRGTTRQRGCLRPRTWDRRAARAPARAAVAAASHASARFNSMQSSVSAPASEKTARLSATA